MLRISLSFRMYHMYLCVPSRLLDVHVGCRALSLRLLLPLMKDHNSSRKFSHCNKLLKNFSYKPLYLLLAFSIKGTSWVLYCPVKSTQFSTCQCVLLTSCRKQTLKIIIFSSMYYEEQESSSHCDEGYRLFVLSFLRNPPTPGNRRFLLIQVAWYEQTIIIDFHKCVIFIHTFFSPIAS